MAFSLFLSTPFHLFQLLRLREIRIYVEYVQISICRNNTFSCEISQWIRLFAFSAITFYYLDRAALVSQKVIRYFEWVTWTERWNKLEIPIKLEISRYRHFFAPKIRNLYGISMQNHNFWQCPNISTNTKQSTNMTHSAKQRCRRTKKKEKTQNVNTLDISQNDA